MLPSCGKGSSSGPGRRSAPLRQRGASFRRVCAREARPGLPRRWYGSHRESVSDSRRVLADEVRDEAGLDEDGVDPGPLEREHVGSRRGVDVGDRELPGRDVGEQLEHRLERVVAVVGVAAGEQEDLRVELLERVLELLLVADVDDVLELGVGDRRRRAGS